MSATRDLPARPSLEHYRKETRDLLAGAKAGNIEALQRIQQHHPRYHKTADLEEGSGTLGLPDAQLVVAREHGFESWARFSSQIDALAHRSASTTIWKRAERAVIEGDVSMLERLLHEHHDLFGQQPPPFISTGLDAEYSTADARTIVARAHHFAQWSDFAVCAEAVADRGSTTARFESAIDAIIAGDLPTLDALLAGRPDLVRHRSTRTHHATLLHYLGANGVEGFRQRTPANAVLIAERLLRAGAEVDALADLYGTSTTLGLVATSIHPQRAGLQEALIDVLLVHGARIDHPGAPGHGQSIVNGCLANGRHEAAAHLVLRGALLDLEAAAGVGHLDIVMSFFTEDGTLKPTATAEQLRDGFTWACEYGHTDVVTFLLDHGIQAGARLPRPHGQTGLHWAAYGGHAETVRVLLAWSAPVDVRDDRFGATPLGWALHGWGESEHDATRSRYYEVVALLTAAGAIIPPEWFADSRGSPLSEDVRTDARMLAALRGTMTV